MLEYNKIQYNQLRSNLDKFSRLKINHEYEKCVVALTWRYISNEFTLIEFEEFFDRKEQLNKLSNNCFYIGYNKKSKLSN